MNWERHGWSMETVINKSLCNVFFSNSTQIFEVIAVQNNFMGYSACLTLVLNIVPILETFSNVVSIQNSYLGCLK